jgi:hypothetical protein
MLVTSGSSKGTYSFCKNRMPGSPGSIRCVLSPKDSSQSLGSSARDRSPFDLNRLRTKKRPVLCQNPTRQISRDAPFN